MAKRRTLIPEDVAAELLFRHDNTCCVCNLKGKTVQIHHLDEDPSNHDPGNLAALCLEDHQLTMVSGGFGRKLNAEQIRKYRDDWIRRVQLRRDRSDELAAIASSGSTTTADQAVDDTPHAPNVLRMRLFVGHLPDAVAAAYKAASPQWAGSNLQMIDGTQLVIDTLMRLWIPLAEWFPPNHFGRPAEEYLEAYVDERWKWHYALSFAGGDPQASSSFALSATQGTMVDLESLIHQTVSAIAPYLEDFDLDAWESSWDEARSLPEEEKS